MSTCPSFQPFRFLDLPGEIRNSIYDLLLCSWDNEPEQDPCLTSKLCRRRPSYRATSLLRASKQIQIEATDYMIKRNQFVRITCRGFNFRDLLLSGQVPVITSNGQRVSRFRGYIMHMTLSKPPALAPSPLQFAEFEIMMLRADLPKLCEQLDIETIMSDSNPTTREHASIHAEIKMSYSHARFLAFKIQEHLLSPIATLLRGITNLSILGPVDPALATSVVSEVARPRWTDPDTTLEEVGTGVDVGKRQWQQNNYYSAAESWAFALRTLERIRHSSSWLGLHKAGGVEFVNKTADLYFTLNMLQAQFLQIDMASEHSTRRFVQRSGSIAIQHLRRCELASARFSQHASATWIPSNQQSARMMFHHAKCFRLMQDTANRIKAVTLIEEAAALAPNEMAIRDEKDAVHNWIAQIEENQRLLEAQSSDPIQHQPGSFWSSVWDMVAELAA